MDSADIATIAIAVLALLFTAGSFWWLNARRGSLTAVAPRTYAFSKAPDGFRLRFPIAVFNDGAIPRLIADLRIVVSDAGTYKWQTTRTSLKPKGDDGHAFAVPFSVEGRSTTMTIAEFGGNQDGWQPGPGSSHEIRLEALVDGEANWIELVTFTWWAPESQSIMNRYVAHRNEQRVTSSIQE